VTAITKTTYRLTVGALDGSYGPDRGRKLVAGLAVGDLLELRPAGTRRAVRLSLFDAYRLAVRFQVQAVDRRAREIKKANGGKLASARKQARKEAGL
jgi:hypothetical protein